MNKLRAGLISVVALVALVGGGTWIYINVLAGEPEAELTLDDLAANTPADTTPDTTTDAASPPPNAISGQWTATSNSEVGYRVQKLLFGQDAESVGRTNDVTGSMTIAGTTIETAEFEVDMTTLVSDSAERDGQVSGRLLETATYPTSRFVLTAPVDLSIEPAAGEDIAVTATGDLTIKGETKSVQLEMTARRNEGLITALSKYPVVFDEWGIENPSVGPIQVEGSGTLEIGLAFEKS